MVALLFHIRCLLLFFVLIQSVYLYKIPVSNDNHPDSSSSSFNEEFDPSIRDNNIEFNDDEDIGENNNSEGWESRLRRSISSIGMQATPQRRNNRQHWNPLVAAYKRCGELVLPEERELCFKDAVQMLFVHKLRK